MRSKDSIPGLSKATLVLDCLGKADAPNATRRPGRHVGLAKSSAHRLLAEHLTRHRPEAGGRCLLGPRLTYRGTIAAEAFDLRTLAEPGMRRLRDELGESVHLYVNDSDSRVSIAAVDARHSLRVFAALGPAGLLGIGSSGRLLLALSNDTRRRTVFAELERAGRPDVPTIGDLDRIRKERFEISYGQRADGVDAAATSIRSADGRAVAATAWNPSCAAPPRSAERIAEDGALASGG